jgi:hypothetical protein
MLQHEVCGFDSVCVKFATAPAGLARHFRGGSCALASYRWNPKDFAWLKETGLKYLDFGI